MPRKRKPEAEATSIEAIDEPRGREGADFRGPIRGSADRSDQVSQGANGVMESEENTDDSERGGMSFKEKEAASSPGVKQAIDSLAEMERVFRQETKRQKLRLAESSVPAHRNFPPQKGSKSHLGSTLDPEARERSPTTIGTFPTADDIIQTSKEGGEADIEAHVRPRGADDDAVEQGATRPPAVNSSYLPLPWNGRLGYACLNTYLRTANPPVFSSRTCQLPSIIEHRHPLQEPSKPEHRTANRPDSNKKPDVRLGQKFLEGLGLLNAHDLVKMVRWNDKYGIKFMRLSSDVFPFASHVEHGYKLAPFASDILAEAGKTIAERGHRVTMHLGQNAQLGSPHEEIVAATVRDIAYHDELLSLLKLPPQQDRDAVTIIHLGGTKTDMGATLDRFRHNYTTWLTPQMRSRLVLENDDITWGIHDLLPLSEELSTPLVINYPNHNIVFDRRHAREGTLDLADPALLDRIAATWEAKEISQMMAYGEPRSGDVDVRDRRSRAARVTTLPPCSNEMDLLVEADDREQAIFELMRNFKLPGFEGVNDLIPHEREDEGRPPKKVPRKKRKKKKWDKHDGRSGGGDEEEQNNGKVVSAEEFGMGGPMRRVFWPVGMEDWLQPRGRSFTRQKVD